MSEQDQSNNPRSFLDRMKKRAETQRMDHFDTPQVEADMTLSACLNCGAGRAKSDGLTACVYCGYEFLGVELSDGIHLSATDNSRK